MTPRQEELCRVFDLEDFLGVVVQQTSLLIAQVDADIAVAFDSHRPVDAHAAVVGGDDNIDIAPGQSLQHLHQRRVLQP